MVCFGAKDNDCQCGCEAVKPLPQEQKDCIQGKTLLHAHLIRSTYIILYTLKVMHVFGMAATLKLCTECINLR